MMVKTAYSEDLQPADQALTVMHTDSSQVKKLASVFGKSYDDMRPPKGHVGIHSAALGAWERYGRNRNADGFRRKACRDYHHTFVKNGHVFEFHANKDPAKALGKIAASAFVEDADRIDLYLHVDEKKAAEHLHKYATTGELPTSMACLVPFDTCSRCDKPRVGPDDPSRCDHMRYDFGKVAADGTDTFAHNDFPNWFDESFVKRPADRIAYSLVMHKQADEADVFQVPSWLRTDMSGYKLACELRDLEAELPIAPAGAYYMDSLRVPQCDRASTMRKIAAHEDMHALFYKLAEHRVLLFPAEFFGYVLGSTVSAHAADIAAVEKLAACGLFTALHQAGMLPDASDMAIYEQRRARDPYTEKVAEELYDVQLPYSATEMFARAFDAPARSVAVSKPPICTASTMKFAQYYGGYALRTIGQMLDGLDLSEADFSKRAAVARMLTALDT